MQLWRPEFELVGISSGSIDDIALVLQQNRLPWYGHVLQKVDDE